MASVQALLENGKGEVRLQVAANCKRTIECLELQSYTEAGDPDKDAGYDHMNDALGYLVYRDFSMLHARLVVVLESGFTKLQALGGI